MNKCTHEQVNKYIGGAFYMYICSYEYGFIYTPPVRLVGYNLITYNASYPLSRSGAMYEHMNNWTYEIGGAARGVPILLLFLCSKTTLFI